MTSSWLVLFAIALILAVGLKGIEVQLRAIDQDLQRIDSSLLGILAK